MPLVDPPPPDSTPPETALSGNVEPARRDYWCFISYRHADNKEPGRQWATWLHQALETYEVPSDLVGTKNERGDTIPDRIFPVFRDEEELPADAELSKPIETALRRSRFLVVLCSPQAAKSRFVAEEILAFKRLEKKDRILAVIIEGEPNASDDPGKGGAERECFPEPLRFEIDEAGLLTDQRTEPIAANFRLSDGSAGWTTPAPYREALRRAGVPDQQIGSWIAEYSKQQHLMLLKIVAGVLGVPLGVLTKRDQAYQLEKQKQRARVLRRWLIALAVLVLATIGSAVWAWQKQRQAVAASTLAEQRRLQAVAAANLAEERQYLAGIQAAAGQLEIGNFTAARQTLITLPKDRRHREWSLLMEWAGAPMLCVRDIEAWMRRNETEQPVLIAQIRAAAKVLPTADNIDRGPGDVPDATIEAPDGSCRVLVEHQSGRPGGFACVVRGELGQSVAEMDVQNLVSSKDPSVIVRIATQTYGEIRGVAFTPDSSMLLVMVKNSFIQGYSEPPVYDLGEKGGEIYIVPIPTRFFPAKPAKSAANPESRAKAVTTPDKDKRKTDDGESNEAASEDSGSEVAGANDDRGESQRTITIAARHGKDVVAKVASDARGDAYRLQLPWPGAAGSAITSEPAEWKGTSRVDANLLPDPARRNAVKLMEEQQGRPKRALAAVRHGPRGTEGLFFVAGGPALLERWDLEKVELIGQLGAGIKLREDPQDPDLKPGDLNFGGLVDWGAAYNADGTRIFALPEGAEGGLEKSTFSPGPQIYDVSSGKLIQTLPPIPFAGEQARGAHPYFGFSFSGNYVYASIYDAPVPSNSIWVARKEANGFVPLDEGEDSPAHPTPAGESETPGAEVVDWSRFVAWSPDDAWRYEVGHLSDTLEVISADGASRYSIPNAVGSGGGPVFDELPAAAEQSAQGRYALGGFIFSRTALEPILRLPVAWMDPGMRSVIVRNRVGNFDLITGSLVAGAEPSVETAAMLLLKWWINMADTKPGGSQPRTVASPPPSQPGASATPSSIASVSPATTSLTTVRPSPPATTSPTPAPFARATLTPPDKVSPPARISPEASMTLAEAERQLTIAYAALRKTMSEAEKQKLKREQIEWIKRKDAIADPSERVRFIQQRAEEFARQVGKRRK
jgi:hypothetical protein